MIDNASHRDLPEILAIYNEVIRNSTAVYTEVELTADRGAIWFDAKLASGFPFIVARDGFGRHRFWNLRRVSRAAVLSAQCRTQRSCSRRSPRPGHRPRVGDRTHELGPPPCTSMHDRRHRCGQRRVHRLHESLGFKNVGHFHEVGFKFGRWLDLVFLQCLPSGYRAPGGTTAQSLSLLAAQS